MSAPVLEKVPEGMALRRFGGGTLKPEVQSATESQLSLKQRLSIFEAFQPNSFARTPKVCIWDGAVRSGKTIASLIAWCIYVIRAPRGGELVVVGRTRDSVGRNVFGPLQDPAFVGALAQHIQYTPGAPSATMFGKKVHVLGASDVRSEMVLRGLTVAGAYVDEATLVAEPFWVQLLARMSVKNSQIFATTNPDGPAHYLNRTVIQKIGELGYKRFHFKITDNEVLMRENPEYVEQLALEYSGLWKRRFIDGEWVQAEGAVYDAYDPDRHVMKPSRFNVERVLIVGLDFGTVHATRAYALGIGPHPYDPTGATKALFVLEEFSPETGQTVGVQGAKFRRWLTEVQDKWGYPEWVAVDSAAAHFRIQLYEEGLTNVMNAHKRVIPGILTVNALFGVNALFISEECTYLKQNISGYMWDPKATKRGDTAPLKENDDEVDALRYAVYSSRLYWRDLIPIAPATEDGEIDGGE